MQATLTGAGEIVVPEALRKKLNLQPGDVLLFDEDAPFLKATKQIDEARMKSVLGRGKPFLAGKTSREWLDELRGTEGDADANLVLTAVKQLP